MRNRRFTFGTALLACGIITLVGSGVYAQTPGTGAPKSGIQRRAALGKQAAERLARLSNELGLRNPQKARIRAILQVAVRERREIARNRQMPPVARRARLLQLRRDTQLQIAAVLTPEQRQRLKQLRKDRLSKRRV